MKVYEHGYLAMLLRLVKKSFFGSLFVLLFLSIGAKHNTFNKFDLNQAKGVSENRVSEDWKPYLDDSKAEFWKEGNHIPDQGFLLLLTNRSLENAKLWLQIGRAHV